MLGEHLDRLLLGDRVVEVATETVEKGRENLLQIRIAAIEERSNARGMSLGDLRDVFRPGLPVATVADLLDDLGVDGVAPLFDLGEGEHPLNRRAIAVGAGLWVNAGHADHLELVVLSSIQLDLVDQRVETVVVRA